MRLSDSVDYTGFGLPRRAPAGVPPGRAFLAGTTVSVQIGRPVPGVAAAVASQPAPPDAARPPGIGTLPSDVPLDRLVPSVALRADTWLVPVGIANTTLEPFCLRLHAGEHAVVAGPARSGKSILLAAVASVVSQARPDCTLLGLVGRSSPPLAAGPGGVRLLGSEDELVSAVEEAAGRGPVLVLVDDAQQVADPTGSLERLLGSCGPHVHAIVAGRGDELRQAFGHWTQSVRKSRTGVVLKVAQPADGDAIGANLPFARSYDARPGRGFAAVDGDAELVQVPVSSET
jgi:DNA segregation ATPase FtsK/SpoIIIE, S-DNA-T family